MYAPWSLSARRWAGLRWGLRRVPRGVAPFTDAEAARVAPTLMNARARVRKAVLTVCNSRAAEFRFGMGAPESSGGVSALASEITTWEHQRGHPRRRGRVTQVE